MLELFIAILILIGSIFMLLASIGLIRMPDLYLRLSATTKAVTLGAGMILLGAAVFFSDLGTSSRAIATIIFLMITTPVSAHMLARASFFNGVPLWDGTKVNQLAGRYDRETHELTGRFQ